MIERSKMKRFRLFPKREKKEVFNYIDFEAARANNPLIKQLHEQQAKTRRTIDELERIRRLSNHCASLLQKYNKEIPQEDWESFWLFEGIAAFLPISIKDHLQLFDKYLEVHIPYREIKIINDD